MKNNNSRILSFAFIICCISCKKESNEKMIVSVNVVHAAVGISTVKVNYVGKPIVYAAYAGTDAQVNFGANKIYSLPVENPTMTIVPVADTLNKLFSGSVSTKANAPIYSLYLIGQAPTNETILFEESIPNYNKADSLTGVRFINLSPNAPSINITLSTSATINEFSDIAYKQSTNFKTYSAKVANTSYTFQIRNASTGALLTSYSYTLSTAPSGRFWNITLVLKGLVGGSGGSALSIQRVNNY